MAAAGGFLDAVGGGAGWQIVTSTLVARGDNPRYVVGSASLCEFLVTMAISAAFLAATLDLGSYWRVILGLVIGGAIAAPFAGWFSRVLPQRVLIGAVAVVVGCLAIQASCGCL